MHKINDFTRPNSRQPIPKEAKIVFSGKLFDIYQWEQEQYDGTKKVFEKIMRPDTVYVLPVNQEGRILICRQTQPGSDTYYGLLGGRVERNEDVLVAAKRELYEEAGMTVETLELWKSFQFLPKLEWAIYVLIGKGISQHERQLDSGEKIDLIDVSIDELFDYASKDSFGDVEIALLLLRVLMNNSENSKLRDLIS
jgi:8-oxo-dGTP pyrophosphatase MutT (NUDIX family)